MATGQDQAPMANGDQHPAAASTLQDRVKVLFEEYRKGGMAPNDAAVKAMQQAKAEQAAAAAPGEARAEQEGASPAGGEAAAAPEAASLPEETPPKKAKTEEAAPAAEEKLPEAPKPEEPTPAAEEKPAEAAEVPATPAAEPEASEAVAGSDDAASPSGKGKSPPKELGPVTGQLLLSIAARLESGDAEATEEAIQVLRKAAGRVSELEGTVAEFGQVLQAVNHVSGHVLQAFCAKEAGAPASPSQEAAASSGGYPEGTKSYLMKKGDADVQEAYHAVAHQRPDKTQHTSAALSSTPKTREEMDAARKARLDMLEKQQAAKRKEQEDGEAKSKARESLFERPLVGAPKTLGKH